MFNYFDKKGIEYTIGPAKNVSKGWLGIRCPIPGCSDESNHCGIAISSLKYHCHVCGSSGSLTELIKEIENCGWAKAKRLVRSFELSTPTDAGPLTPPSGRSRGAQLKPFNWPDDIYLMPKYNPPLEHIEYLRGRGFRKPEELFIKYGLRTTAQYGYRCKYSIIIPVFLNRKIVTFTSRDITGKAYSKYWHLPDDESIIPIKDTVYGIDSVRRGVLLVEGVTDVWKIGDGACAIYGSTITDEQVELLIEKEVENIFILLDSDAVRAAERLRDKLSGTFPYVEWLSISTGDPASSLTRSNIKVLRDLIDGK